MQAKTLTFNAGWGWLRAGFQLYRKNPPLLAMLTFAYWIVLLSLQLVPGIGPVVASVLMPALSVGMMAACREIAAGKVALPLVLFSGLRGEARRTLLILGVAYLVYSMLVVTGTSLVDGGVFLAALMSEQGLDENAIAAGTYLPAAWFITLGMIPAIMAWWYAPVLAAWHGLGVGKALFFSWIASWRNMWAFTGYGLALLLFTLILPVFALSFLLGLWPQGAQMLLSLLLIPLLLLLAPSVFASFYISYVDVFSEGADVDA